MSEGQNPTREFFVAALGALILVGWVAVQVREDSPLLGAIIGIGALGAAVLGVVVRALGVSYGHRADTSTEPSDDASNDLGATGLSAAKAWGRLSLSLPLRVWLARRFLRPPSRRMFRLNAALSASQKELDRLHAAHIAALAKIDASLDEALKGQRHLRLSKQRIQPRSRQIVITSDDEFDVERWADAAMDGAVVDGLEAPATSRSALGSPRDSLDATQDRRARREREAG